MSKARSTSVPSSDLISVAEAAALVGCVPQTIRRRIADGSLRGFRLGPRVIRVNRDEVQGLLSLIPAAGQTA